ncbi:hypothetical protein ACFQJC_03090 [Haloferax namakaokahaiae]|uniref:Rhomboid family intramembrane serine protease n=1 Tax=Haloferax namakaokahaiae TaxID=1748331 RepID=A0ABD5ZB61_9EURY
MPPLTHTKTNLARDVALLLAPVPLLLALHFLTPQSIHSQFVFTFDLSEPWRLLTAAYFHNSDSHLYNNLGGYAVGALLTWMLCLRMGERRWFHVTFAALLLAVPVLTQLSTFAVFTHQFGPDLQTTSRGFSGVVSGFGGFAFVALLALISTAYSRTVVWYSGFLIVLVFLNELLVIYTGTVSPTVIGLTGLGAVLSVGEMYRQSDVGFERPREAWKPIAIDAMNVVLIVALLVIYVYMLFPSTIVSDGTTTNIYAHALAMVWGGLVAAATYQLPTI